MALETEKNLTDLRDVLDKFNEPTLLVSEEDPQVSLAVPIYYEIHDLLYAAYESIGLFAGIGEDVGSAVSGAIRKYSVYYDIMDASTDVYYTTLALDSRVNGKLLKYELSDEEARSYMILCLVNNEVARLPALFPRSELKFLYVHDLIHC